MNEFIITSPDGQEFVITAPEGASEEEIMAYAQSQFSSQQPAAEQDARQAVPEQTDYMTREELMTGNPIEDAAIGLGRFATEVGQGVKQKYLDLFGDEGKADAYTQQIAKEKELYDKGTQGAGIEDIGYYGGMLAPALVTGGASSLPAVAAIGAAESAVMPSYSGTEEERWKDTGKQAAIGGTIGGLARALPDAFTGLQQLNRNRRLGNVDPEVAALAEKYDLKIPRSVSEPTFAGKTAEVLGQVPVLGRVGASKMKRDAEDVLRKIKSDNAGENVQEAFRRGKEEVDNFESRMWEDGFKANYGDAPINRQRLNQKLDDIVGNLKEDTIGQGDADRLKSLFRPVKQTQPFKRTKNTTMDDYDAWVARKEANEQLRGFSGDTADDLHRFRAKFSAKNKQKLIDDGWNSATVDNIYGALTEELKDTIYGTYGDDGLEAFQDAVDYTKNLRRTLDNTRVNKSAIKDRIDSNKSFVNAALGDDADRIQAMKTIMGERGAPAVRAEIADNLLSTLTTKGNAAAKNRIDKLGRSIDAFFDPDDAAALRGMAKFLDNLPATEKKTLDSVLRSGIGAGLMYGSGGTAALVGAALPKWLARKDVTAMLQKLSKTPQDSKLYKALTDELMATVYAGTGTAAATDRQVPQIEIRDGRPQ